MLRTSILAAALALSLPLHAQTIRAGQTVNGELSASDPRLDDGSHYDLYTFRGRRGERVNFEMRSQAFDAWLSIGRMANGRYTELRSDDDDAGGTNAHIEFTVQDEGEYVLRANSAFARGRGAYTLVAIPVDVPRITIAGTLTPGSTVRGSLGEGDAMLPSQLRYELWRFSGRAGQRVELVMRSTAFDSYLTVGQMHGTHFETLRTDDDSAGGLDARVRLVLPADGEYVVRTTPREKGDAGTYTLSLAEN